MPFDAVGWLANWIDIAETASWHSIREVRKLFPSADGVRLKSGVVITVFNVRGNEYPLLTVINYKVRRVAIFDVLTHAEYKKEKWK